MSKVLIAYHANCIDGFTAAWVAAKAMTEREGLHNTLPMDYTDYSRNRLVSMVKRAAFEPFDTLYILDYSVPLDILAQLTAIVPSVVVLDHHKTAFEAYGIPLNLENVARPEPVSKYGASILLDNLRSGAGIAWAYFFPEQATPWIVRYVQDRDLWNFNYRDTKAVHEFLSSAARDFPTWTRLADLLDNPSKKTVCINAGQTLLRQWDEEVKVIAAEAKPVGINGIGGYVVRCHGKYASDVGNVLALRGGTFGLTFDISSDYSTLKYSLRSVGDLDVSAVAKKLGGGGHKNAAGFESIYLPYQLFATIEEL
jgi:uncharacterized protein